jgi:hypothetical protein
MNTTEGPVLDGTARRKQRRLPSPSLVLATAALFVALTGGATAAGIVAYAKHAGTADNAKHLGGKTAAQIAATVRGPAGPQGAAGATGPAGPKGDQGAAGPTGATGPQGEKGAIGPAGPQGDTGAVGPVGPAGPQGDKGDKGDMGAAVKIVGTLASQADLPSTGTTGDAYLIGGHAFVWTGSAWTDAGPVQGPKGDTGDTGPAGPQGPQGIQGPQGAPGTAAVSVHKTPYSLGPQVDQVITGACDAGQKAVSAGFDDSTGTIASFDSTPTAADDGWQLELFNFDSTVTATGSVYVVCLG